eukprot:1377890-Pleurochrysis_carterae.AAC.1
MSTAKPQGYDSLGASRRLCVGAAPPRLRESTSARARERGRALRLLEYLCTWERALVHECHQRVLVPECRACVGTDAWLRHQALFPQLAYDAEGFVSKLANPSDKSAGAAGRAGETLREQLDSNKGRDAKCRWIDLRPGNVAVCFAADCDETIDISRLPHSTDAPSELLPSAQSAVLASLPPLLPSQYQSVFGLPSRSASPLWTLARSSPQPAVRVCPTAPDAAKHAHCSQHTNTPRFSKL